MTHRTTSVIDDGLLSDDAADEAVYRALTLFIGRGKRFSVEDIETGTNRLITASTVSKWITPNVGERRRPRGSCLLLLCQFIGVEFTNKLLGPIGQGGRDLNPTPDAPAAVVATLMAGASEFAAKAVDGRYCHQDCGELEDDADQMIQILTPFSSRGKGL